MLGPTGIGVVCRNAALNRIVPWFVTHLWMATRDNGLAAVSRTIQDSTMSN
jgi:selenocysteine lyase/cysteine desulfurase